MTPGEREWLRQRRLRTMRSRRDLALAFLVAQVVIVAAGLGDSLLFALWVLLTGFLLAWSAGAVHTAKRAVAVQPPDRPLDKGYIRQQELEVWDRVFHCFGHNGLVALRQEDDTCPECGGRGEAPAPAAARKPLERGRGLGGSARHQARLALAYAAEPGADPREACRLIREALRRVCDRRDELSPPGPLTEADESLADALMDAFEGAESRPPVLEAASGLEEAMRHGRGLLARGTMTLTEAVAAHNGLVHARRRLLASRADWDSHSLMIMVMAAESLMGTYAERLSVAGPAVVECPALGDPPGCSEFVLARPGQATVINGEGWTVIAPGGRWLDAEAGASGYVTIKVQDTGGER